MMAVMRLLSSLPLLGSMNTFSKFVITSSTFFSLKQRTPLDRAHRDVRKRKDPHHLAKLQNTRGRRFFYFNTMLKYLPRKTLYLRRYMHTHTHHIGRERESEGAREKTRFRLRKRIVYVRSAFVVMSHHNCARQQK